MELIMKKYNTPEIRLVSLYSTDIITLSIEPEPEELVLDLADFD